LMRTASGRDATSGIMSSAVSGRGIIEYYQPPQTPYWAKSG